LYYLLLSLSRVLFIYLCTISLLFLTALLRKLFHLLLFSLCFSLRGSLSLSVSFCFSLFLSLFLHLLNLCVCVYLYISLSFSLSFSLSVSFPLTHAYMFTTSLTNINHCTHSPTCSSSLPSYSPNPSSCFPLFVSIPYSMSETSLPQICFLIALSPALSISLSYLGLLLSLAICFLSLSLSVFPSGLLFLFFE